MAKFQWIDFPFKVKSSTVKIITPKDENICNFKYLFYLMKSKDFKIMNHWRQFIEKYSQQIFNIHNLDTQLKIVNLLDNLTYWITNLNKYLEIENINRSKQFKFYLDLLLNLNISENLVNQYKITDLVEYFRWNKISKKEIKSWWKYKVISWWEKEMWYFNNYNDEWNHTIISRLWSAWFVSFINEKSFINSFAISFRSKNTNILLDKYFFYLLKNHQSFIQSHFLVWWWVKKINLIEFNKLKFNIPDIKIQQKIVNILDTFNKYIHWLTNNKTWLSNLIKLNNKLLKFYLETLIK